LLRKLLHLLAKTQQIGMSRMNAAPVRHSPPGDLGVNGARVPNAQDASEWRTLSGAAIEPAPKGSQQAQFSRCHL
jgi:hypothetical protein